MISDIRDAREELKELKYECANTEEYIDAIWQRRYVKPSELSSSAWPFKSNKKEEISNTNVRHLKNAK